MKMNQPTTQPGGDSCGRPRLRSTTLRRRSLLRAASLSAAFTMAAGVSLNCPALTITVAPSFTPAVNAPLAGVLQLATDVASRVSVLVNDGTNTWQRYFYDYSTTHSVPLLGFKSNRKNTITVTVRDRFQNAVTARQPLNFTTAPLPSDFPKSVLLASQPNKMEPGYTLFRLQNYNDGAAYLTIVDNAGEVVWYSAVRSTLDVRQLANGDLFVPLTMNFAEINMLGQTVNSWEVPDGVYIDFHDGVPTPHNSILYLTDNYQLVTGFPTSATNPNAPLQDVFVLYNSVVEMSATNNALLNEWSLIDMLQPTRIDYLTFSLGDIDTEHANAVIEDPSDDSLIVSMRHQDAVIKFSRSGQLKWILGPHENWDAQFQPYLLTPVGAPFEWSYGQHAPILTPQGTLLLFDDGNFRASPFAPGVPDADNYSRAVEYSINEQTMEVTQVWDYGRTNADRLYTDRAGNADWLPQQGNVLITFANTLYENGAYPSPIAPGATMLRIKEVTHDADPQVVFDLAFFDYGNTATNFLGYYAYRSHRIPDLYSILPQPVADLAVQFRQGAALLTFSANEARAYTVQASPNLAQWEDIGTAEDTGNGNFEFADLESAGGPLLYYRVVTQ